VQAAQSRQVFLLEGMWIRFLPSIKQLLDIIATNQIGDIISVQANMSFKAPRDDCNRYFNPDLGGGSLLDLGVYPVFLASLLLGRPDTIKAIARLSNKGIDEACAMLFQYNSGQYAILESTLVAQTDLTATIYGSKGYIKILANWNEKPEGIEIAMYNGDTTRIPLHWEGRGFQFEVAETMRCIEQQLIFSPMLDHQFSLDMMKTMDTIKDQVHVKYKPDE
jgi:predicted dehydrogenase